MSDIISGGRAFLTVDNVSIGYAAGVSGGQDIAYQPVDVLNDMYPREQIAVGITVRFQCNFIRVLTSKYSEALRITDDRGNAGEKYLLQQGFNAVVEDRLGEGKGKFISAFGLKLATRNFDTAARTLFTENASFVGIALDFNDNDAAV